MEIMNFDKREQEMRDKLREVLKEAMRFYTEYVIENSQDWKAKDILDNCFSLYNTIENLY